METKKWYQLNNPEDVISPSLLVYPDRIEENIKAMIRMVGDVSRLRPHVKTHKTAEIIKMQLRHGIQKFKCATIAEAELLAQCSAKDILLAMQPVGANIKRLFTLMEAYPNSNFSTIADSMEAIQTISEMAGFENRNVALYVDLNTGMNRTGIAPEHAQPLFKAISVDDHLIAKGLHTYDGHIRNANLEERKKVCDAAFDRVLQLKNTLEKQGIQVETIVAGGSPSFPIHAKRQDVEASPGTTLLWDERYGTSFKEMEFLPAAVLLSRIISKPANDMICLDLGHKSIAPEMNFPRVKIFGLEHCKQIGQSEEHLVIHCPKTEHYQIGDVFYAVPMHICPTVAKYPELLVVENGEITTAWKVAARNYKINI